MSYALDAKSVNLIGGQDTIIDSGAFSVWNSGKTIDIDDYLNFCLKQPKNWTFINLDVIPPKNSTQKEVENCVIQGYENYLYLKDKLPNVMPVYHSGEDIEWLKKYMEHTDYIGIGFGNNRGEIDRRKLLSEVFNLTGLKCKIHGLGYSSESGMKIFPFYSVDSVSFKTIHNLYGSGINFWTESKNLDYYMRYKIKQFLKFEREITELWELRGVNW